MLCYTAFATHFMTTYNLQIAHIYHQVLLMCWVYCGYRRKVSRFNYRVYNSVKARGVSITENKHSFQLSSQGFFPTTMSFSLQSLNSNSYVFLANKTVKRVHFAVKDWQKLIFLKSHGGKSATTNPGPFIQYVMYEVLTLQSGPGCIALPPVRVMLVSGMIWRCWRGSYHAGLKFFCPLLQKMSISQTQKTSKYQQHHLQEKNLNYWKIKEHISKQHTIWMT